MRPFFHNGNQPRDRDTLALWAHDPHPNQPAVILGLTVTNRRHNATLWRHNIMATTQRVERDQSSNDIDHSNSPKRLKMVAVANYRHRLLGWRALGAMWMRAATSVGYARGWAASRSTYE